jgi:hypothetical protein
VTSSTTTAIAKWTPARLVDTAVLDNEMRRRIG